MSYDVTLLVFGILLLLLGLVGKVKAKEIEVGTSSATVRVVTVLLGFFLIVFSFNPDIPKTFLSKLTGDALESVDTEQARLAEDQARKDEQARLAEDQARKDEQARLAKDQARKDEQARLAKDQARKDEQARLAKDQARKDEQARLAEDQARKDEQARLAKDQARKDEQARLAKDQARKDEQARLAEDQVRKDEQARLAKDQARKDEQARLAEDQARKDEQARLAEDQARKDAESTASLSEQPTINADGSNIDMSGIYISEITASGNAAGTKRFLEKKNRKEITLKQTGNTITGSDSSGNFEINGTWEGNIIKFYIVKGNEIEGIWETNADATKLVGKWKTNGGGGASGKWNLTRVGPSASIIENKSISEFTASSQNPEFLVDVSGTYISEITSNSKWQLTREFQKLKIKLTQEGTKILGIDERYDTKIEATIAGDVVKFYVLAGQATAGYDVEGEWKISSDGTRLVGTWVAPNSGDAAAGDWILRKIQ